MPRSLKSWERVGEAWEVKIKEELQTSKETIRKLEAQIKKDEIVTNDRAWVSNLEMKLVDANSNVLVLEAQL